MSVLNKNYSRSSSDEMPVRNMLENQLRGNNKFRGINNIKLQPGSRNQKMFCYSIVLVLRNCFVFNRMAQGNRSGQHRRWRLAPRPSLPNSPHLCKELLLLHFLWFVVYSGDNNKGYSTFSASSAYGAPDCSYSLGGRPHRCVTAYRANLTNFIPSQTTSPSATKPHVKPVNAAVSKVHQTLSIIFLHNLLEWPNRLLYGSQDNRNKNRWKHKAVEEGATNNCAHKY